MSHSQNATVAEENIAHEQQQPLAACEETAIIHHNQELSGQVNGVAELASDDAREGTEAVAIVAADAAVADAEAPVAEVTSTEVCLPNEGAQPLDTEEPSPAKDEAPNNSTEATTAEVVAASEPGNENATVAESDASKSPVVVDLTAVSPVLSTPANEISTTVTTQTGVAANTDESDVAVDLRRDAVDVLEEGGSQAAPPVEAVPKRAAERDSNDEADELTAKMPRTEPSAAPCEPCDGNQLSTDSGLTAEVDVQVPVQPAS